MKYRYSQSEAICLLPMSVLLILIAMPCQVGYADSWKQKLNMPTARTSAEAAVVDSLVYVTGGFQGNHICLSTNEAYDRATDTWATKTPMPTAREGHVFAAVNGKIYAIGGAPSVGATLSVNEEYDPVTDTWTT